jgi:hypothetical protein
MSGPHLEAHAAAGPLGADVDGRLLGAAVGVVARLPGRRLPDDVDAETDELEPDLNQLVDRTEARSRWTLAAGRSVVVPVAVPVDRADEAVHELARGAQSPALHVGQRPHARQRAKRRRPWSVTVAVASPITHP